MCTQFDSIMYTVVRYDSVNSAAISTDVIASITSVLLEERESEMNATYVVHTHTHTLPFALPSLRRKRGLTLQINGAVGLFVSEVEGRRQHTSEEHLVSLVDVTIEI